MNIVEHCLKLSISITNSFSPPRQAKDDEEKTVSSPFADFCPTIT